MKRFELIARCDDRVTLTLVQQVVLEHVHTHISDEHDPKSVLICSYAPEYNILLLKMEQSNNELRWECECADSMELDPKILTEIFRSPKTMHYLMMNECVVRHFNNVGVAVEILKE